VDCSPALIAVAQIPLLRLVSVVCRRFLPDVLVSTRPLRRRPIVALTLDDAPSAISADVLKVLSDHDAQATFFVIGAKASLEPEIVEQIVAAGHELGNHTWCDESTFMLSPERLKRSLRATHQLLAQVDNVRLVRPGGGWLRTRILAAVRELDCSCVLASVYPHDLRVSKRFTIAYVLRFAKPGAIIVLHEGRPERKRLLEILPIVLSQLKRRGYEVTTVSELLNQSG
jgi:peptidoglycan-N-acetylglucosamine deacetylase